MPTSAWHGRSARRRHQHAAARWICGATARPATACAQKFGYCFETPPGSEYPPILNAHEIPEPFAPFEIAGRAARCRCCAFGQGHGRIRSLGFRFGAVAYSPDVDGLDEEAFAALEGVECWIVDALRYTPHPSHAHLSRTLEWIARVKPKRAILTNMHVDHGLRDAEARTAARRRAGL